MQSFFQYKHYFLKHNACRLFVANPHIIIFISFSQKKLTIINRSQNDGAEQPCDDADGGHLRFPRRGSLLT